MESNIVYIVLLWLVEEGMREELWVMEEGKREVQWVVEEGKGGSFTCEGGGKVGRGAFSSSGALLRARLWCSFIGLCL